MVDCHYPLIHRSNDEPYHFLHGFVEHLNDVLGLEIRATQFRGDIHMSPEEREWFEASSAKGRAPRFWLFASGGKFDYTIKWWRRRATSRSSTTSAAGSSSSRWARPSITTRRSRGPSTCAARRSLRQLMRLMHHAEGAVAAVSLLMHLAAAVDDRPGMPKNRPCVVVAGGREPPHFTAYPHHQFIHTVGALRCCDNGGCWKSRTLPLGDGDPKDPGSCASMWWATCPAACT